MNPIEVLNNFGIDRLGVPPPQKAPYIPPPGVPDLTNIDEELPPVNDLDREARAYLRRNPQTWETICGMVRMLLTKNKPFSMKMVVEVARYLHIVSPNAQSITIADRYTAYLPALFIHFWPESAEFIKTNRKFS